MKIHLYDILNATFITTIRILQNPTSLGVHPTWNPFVNWFTSVDLSKLTARGHPSPLTTLLNRHWAVMASFASRIWFTKLPPLDPTSNTFQTACGPWNWTLLLEDGARRPTTLLKVVTSAAVKTKLMPCYVSWSNLMSHLCRNIPTFKMVIYLSIVVLKRVPNV